LLAAAAVAAAVSAGFLWGSMRTAQATYPSMHNFLAWAYFQFLLFVVLAAFAVVGVLKALRPASKVVAVLIGLTAAFASVVGVYGVLGFIEASAGSPNPDTRFAIPAMIAITAVSMLVYWHVARRAGAGKVAVWLGTVATLPFTPLFIIGAYLYCGAFAPHMRCI